MFHQSIARPLLWFILVQFSQGFVTQNNPRQNFHFIHSATKDSAVSVSSVEEASSILEKWDEHYNNENFSGKSLPEDVEKLRDILPSAVKLLNEAAREERDRDSALGRCMLGICASSTEQGITALKSWVTGLALPRGLLHGADKDGVPLQIEGGVYIKCK
jgi:Domain of unknown function (DUF1824)